MKSGSKSKYKLTELFTSFRLKERAPTESLREVVTKKTQSLPKKTKKKLSVLIDPLFKHHKIPQLNIDVLDYIFQFDSVFENPQFRAVSPLFCMAWELAAKKQLGHLNPIMKRWGLDNGYEILLNIQQREATYLIEHQKEILGKVDKYNSVTLNAVFNKLENIGNNINLIAYQVREECLDMINEIIIRNQIAETEKSKFPTELDCSGCYLTRFSKGLTFYFCSKLSSLSVSNNPRLRTLPKTIGLCFQLKALDISFCNFSELPNDLGKCTMLKRLYVNDNYITRLDAIGHCWALEQIDAQNNQITRLPDNIVQCVNLRHLCVTENCLSALPDGLSENILRDEFGKINKTQCLAAQKKLLIENKEEKKEQMRFH